MPEAPKEDNAPEAPAAPVEKAAEGDGEPEPVKTVSGLPHRRFTSFSISDPGEIKPIVSLEKREAEMLTQEKLEELWKELIERSRDDEKLYELLADKKVELKNNNLFAIQVPNIYFDSLLKEYQTQILGFLREATGNESLQYKATVVTEYVEKKAYMPREKFDELLKINPAILSLRKLFPDIDF